MWKCTEKEKKKGASGIGTGKRKYWTEIGFRGRRGAQKGKINRKTRKEGEKVEEKVGNRYRRMESREGGTKPKGKSRT
jgi:hypothetical protein